MTILIILSYINYKYSKGNITKLIQAQNTATIEGVSIHLQGFFDERIKRMVTLSNILRDRHEGIDYFIENEFKEDGKYFSIAYLDIDGNYIYRSPENSKYKGKNVKETFKSKILLSDLQKAKETKKPKVSDIYEMKDNVLGISIVIPVIENGEVTGFFGSSYKMEDIGKEIVYSKIKQPYEEVVGITKDGFRIFSSNKDIIGKNIFGKDFENATTETKEVQKKIMNGEELSTEYEAYATIDQRGYNGKPIKKYIVSKPVYLDGEYKFSLGLAIPLYNLKVLYKFVIYQLMIFLTIALIGLTSLFFFIKNYRERQGLEESLAQSEAYDKFKTDFFCNMSHELRTPLTIMLNAIQIILSKYPMEQEEDGELKKMLYKIRQNAYRLLKLVNNFLEISRMDSGFEIINPVNIDIVKVIEDITLSVVFYAKQKGIKLIFDTQVEEKIVAIDEDGIEKVIMNLLSNAIKFTPIGGEIFVNIFEEKEFIKISVKDTGVGIPEDKTDFIFQRFTQVNSTLRRTAEGTGIGLAIVKKIIEMHGGKISVISKEGKGSEFIVFIPNKIIEGETSANKKINQEMFNDVNIEFSDL